MHLILQPESQVHIHWKGAAEIILASCTGYIDANDHIVSMDEDKVCQNWCLVRRAGDIYTMKLINMVLNLFLLSISLYFRKVFHAFFWNEETVNILVRFSNIKTVFDRMFLLMILVFVCRSYFSNKLLIIWLPVACVVLP